MAAGTSSRSEIEEGWSISNSADWNPDEVASWLRRARPELNNEAELLQVAEISGAGLPVLDRKCLEEIGITSIGKQLAVLGCIKQLLAKKEECLPSSSSVHNSSTPVKVKITRKDKKEMSPEQKHLYHSKIKIIRKECQKRWPGNNKVYFRSNNTNSLVLSELASSLLPICEIKELGFGESAIRRHIMQWVSEKNRKITDGFDFEKTRTPAKRAKFSLTSSGEEGDASQIIAVTDVQKPEASEDGADENVDHISDYSAQLVCAVTFHVAVFRNLSIKKHLSPAAKVFSIKSRGCGKYDLATKIAIALIKNEYVFVQPPVNFKELTRQQITILKHLDIKSSGQVQNLDNSSSTSTLSVDETDTSPFSSSESSAND